MEDLDVTFVHDSANNIQKALVDVPTLQDAIRAPFAGQREAIEMLKLRQLSLREASSVARTHDAARWFHVDAS